MRYQKARSAFHAYADAAQAFDVLIKDPNTLDGPLKAAFAKYDAAFKAWVRIKDDLTMEEYFRLYKERPYLYEPHFRERT